MKNIMKSFQGMLDRLDWMDDASKVGAYSKITDIAVNVIASPFVFNDTKLNKHYEALSFGSTDGYIEMKKKLDVFNFVETYEVLRNNYPVDRYEFHLPPAVVNA